MKVFYLLALAWGLHFTVQGQYISRSQPVPYNCPTLCPGSTLILNIPQVQNLNNGDMVQALFSSSSGSFAAGTTTLPGTRYSLNQGNTWTNGPFQFSSNVNDLYMEVTIPANFPAGSNYTIKLKSSSGYTSGDLFQCNGGNYITVNPAYSTTPAVSYNTVGNNKWYGHVYTWTSNTQQLLTTPQLVNAQDFFNQSNYKGHFIKNAISFDLNYNTASGGTCPGTPGTLNEGTSIPCSQGYATNYSIRFLRTENFAAGSYKFELQGDDGVRLSIDGGNTWLLSSYFEQKYQDSYQSTATSYPNGICLSGSTNLVIEFFQRNVDSRVTFTATLLSGTSVGDAGNQSVCQGANAAFNLSNSSTNLTYQWYYSTDDGNNFVQVPNTAPFSDVNTARLRIQSVPVSYNNYLFRCQVGGLCGNPVNTPVDTLFVGDGGLQATLTADKEQICASDSARLCAPANAISYHWNTNATTQCITAKQAGNYYATVTYGSGCEATSNRVSLTVYPVTSISITVKADTLTVYSGLTWQWYLDGNAIQGATSKIYVATEPGSYTVRITDSYGCENTSSPVEISSTGIEEIQAAGSFTIYPNPVSENSLLTVTASSAYLNKKLYLFDLAGRLIHTWPINDQTMQVDVSLLAKGIYFLKAEDTARKFIKQ